MRTAFLAAVFPLLALTPVRAHIGSPNIFFEGQAGPHAVRVVIRPPPTLPGLAQIDVRLAGEETAEISVQAAPWAGGDETAPPPVGATPVAGEPGLFNATLWLLGRGSYRVRVTVENPRGSGAVSVPLNSAATQAPTMPPALGTALLVAGGLLFLGAVILAGAAARESTLASEKKPSPRDATRARRVMLIVTIVLGAAAIGGTRRWQAMDGEFRNNALAHPVPVEATIREAGTLRLLRLTQSESGAPDAPWDTLVTDHGKLMHLFLCREPDFTAFAHLHPVRRDAFTFENVLPPLPAGDYRLYAEVTRENGLSQTLVSRLALPAPSGPELPPLADWKTVNEVWCRAPTVPVENAGQPFALDPDDSWHTGPEPSVATLRTQVSPLLDGRSMVFHNAGDLVAGRESPLRFTVFDADGRQVTLQPYMGMRGHAVVRRADGAVFAHLHPAGSVSMAAQEMLAQRDRPAGVPPVMPSATGDEVAFPYAFPRAGKYRVWTQVRVAGRVLTGDFAVEVKEAP